MILEEYKIKNAKEFIKNWTNKGYEKGESQKFWIELLTKVYGVENITEFIKFEDTVKLDKTTGIYRWYYFRNTCIDRTKIYK